MQVFISPARYVVACVISVTTLLVAQHANARLAKRCTAIDGALIATFLLVVMLFLQDATEHISSDTEVRTTATFLQSLLVVLTRQAASIILAVQLSRILETLAPTSADTGSLVTWMTEFPWELYVLILVAITFVTLNARSRSNQPVNSTPQRNLSFLIHGAITEIAAMTTILMVQHVGFHITAKRTPIDGFLMTMAVLMATLFVASSQITDDGDLAGTDTVTVRFVQRLVTTSIFQATSILVSVQLNRLLETFAVVGVDADTIAAWIAELPWELYVMVVIVLVLVAPPFMTAAAPRRTEKLYSDPLLVKTLELDSAVLADSSAILVGLPPYIATALINVVNVASVLISQHAANKIIHHQQPFEGFVIALFGVVAVIFLDLSLEDVGATAEACAPRLALAQRMFLDALRQGINVVMSLQINRLMESLAGSVATSDSLVWWVADFPWELYILLVMLTGIVPMLTGASK